ncbi:MAG TPA: TetR/AcrR family transcriptional regulator [Euzebya sp.]|nr:TetR/AcrR family transcriptional regulator [Euzebya sp.]
MDGEATRDRRVQRTERALSDALFSLIQTKRYDRVTVQDIVEHADVGRSTFYSHFATKDDLLLGRLTQLTADIDRHMADAAADDGPVLPSLGLFQHVVEREPMFRALIGSSGIELVTREVRRMLRDRALATIRAREQRGITHPTPPHLRAAFLAGSLTAFVQWWLDNGMNETAAEMDEAFQRCVANA